MSGLASQNALLFGFAGTCLLLVSCAALPPVGPVAVESRRILANARDTAYEHRTTVDEVAGQYHLDCSGFASLLLRSLAPRALAVVESADHPFHPRAFAFHEVFAAAPTNRPDATNGWLRVVRVQDLRPGDFVAWRKVAWERGETTGHVVIVDARPVRETNGSWRVAVIDSTTRPHADDTRPPGTGGIGRGTIWFTVDAAGRPNGIRSLSREDPPKTNMPIAAGRLVGTPNVEPCFARASQTSDL